MNKTLSIVFGIVLVVLIGIAVYFAIGKRVEPAEDTTSPAGWLTHVNSQYGYELKLPDTWKGYKIVETSDLIFNNVKYVEYALPTKDSKYYSMAGRGMITIFTVGIYPSSEWQKAQGGKYGPKPTLLGQNSKYYFGYYTQKINTADRDFMKKDLQISAVAKTFQLAK